MAEVSAVPESVYQEEEGKEEERDPHQPPSSQTSPCEERNRYLSLLIEYDQETLQAMPQVAMEVPQVATRERGRPRDTEDEFEALLDPAVAVEIVDDGESEFVEWSAPDGGSGCLGVAQEEEVMRVWHPLLRRRLNELA